MATVSVLGMDPSLRNWGLAAGRLDLISGCLSDLDIQVVRPKEETSKQVRKNSKDLEIARLLATALEPAVTTAKIIFVEVPVGSQSARAMASYGVCVGILGTFQARGFQIIEVTASEVKLALTGNKEASKQDMIAAASSAYGGLAWPMHKGKIAAHAEHMADAIAAIHAGVRTPTFQNLLRIYKDSIAP